MNMHLHLHLHLQSHVKYSTKLLSHNHPPALQVFASYGNFQPDNDPPSFTDAMRRPDADLWWDAFCAEMKAIIANSTWVLTDLPLGFKALPLKWVCRTKRDTNK